MSKYLLLIFYVLISILIGKEFHPFSTFPMYNSFPNYGYVFFLKNEKGEIVTFGRNFSKSKNAGYIAHTFYSLCEHYGFNYGFGKENSEDLKKAGKEMLEMILYNEDEERFNFDSLKLYRRFYFLENKKLKYRDDLMYGQSLK